MFIEGDEIEAIGTEVEGEVRQVDEGGVVELADDGIDAEFPFFESFTEVAGAFVGFFPSAVEATDLVMDFTVGAIDGDIDGAEAGRGESAGVITVNEGGVGGHIDANVVVGHMVDEGRELRVEGWFTASDMDFTTAPLGQIKDKLMKLFIRKGETFTAAPMITHATFEIAVPDEFEFNVERAIRLTVKDGETEIIGIGGDFIKSIHERIVTQERGGRQ